MRNIIIFIIFMLIIFVIKKKKIEKFYVNRNQFITYFDNIIDGELVYKDNIKIKKLNNSSKLIVYDINITNKLPIGHIFNRNMNFFVYNENNQEKNRLKYNLQESEHKNNLYSGYYISKPITTKKKNKNYGFLFDYNPIEFNSHKNLNENGREYNNLCEFSIDFQKKKQKHINNLVTINDKFNSKNYRNIKRKTVNIFSIQTSPPEFLNYFKKGDNNKKTKLIILFYDQVNFDFLNSFTNNRFNILDSKLHPIITNCKLDTPYCNINLNKQNNILGRDKYIMGKFNSGLNKYTVYDSDEYIKYKKNLIQ